MATVTLIVFGSLVPWAGWVDRGLSPLAFLFAPLPRYLTSFDVIFNALAYLPLGALLVFAMHPRLRGVRAVAAAVAFGAALSALMEALQTYLPARISSNVDFLTNTLGTLVGAVLAASYASSVIDRGRLLEVRDRWFQADASLMLFVMLLWPLAQLHPTQMLFGSGAIPGSADALREWFGVQPLPTVFAPGEFMLAEAFVVFASLLGVGLAFAAIQRPGAPRGKLVAALIVTALLAKSLAYGNRLGPERALAWLTPGAVAGLCCGGIALAVAVAAPRRVQLHGALLCTLLWLVTVNIVPANPYHHDVFAGASRVIYLRDLLRWFAVAWPLLLAVLLGAASVASWRPPRAR